MAPTRASWKVCDTAFVGRPSIDVLSRRPHRGAVALDLHRVDRDPDALRLVALKASRSALLVLGRQVGLQRAVEREVAALHGAPVLGDRRAAPRPRPGGRGVAGTRRRAGWASAGERRATGGGGSGGLRGREPASGRARAVGATGRGRDERDGGRRGRGARAAAAAARASIASPLRALERVARLEVLLRGRGVVLAAEERVGLRRRASGPARTPGAPSPAPPRAARGRLRLPPAVLGLRPEVLLERPESSPITGCRGSRAITRPRAAEAAVGVAARRTRRAPRRRRLETGAAPREPGPAPPAPRRSPGPA